MVSVKTPDPPSAPGAETTPGQRLPGGRPAQLAPGQGPGCDQHHHHRSCRQLLVNGPAAVHITWGCCLALLAPGCWWGSRGMALLITLVQKQLLPASANGSAAVDGEPGLRLGSPAITLRTSRDCGCCTAWGSWRRLTARCFGQMHELSPAAASDPAHRRDQSDRCGPAACCAIAVIAALSLLAFRRAGDGGAASLATVPCWRSNAMNMRMEVIAAGCSPA